MDIKVNSYNKVFMAEVPTMVGKNVVAGIKGVVKQCRQGAKELSDQTLVSYSTAMAAAAIAGISIKQKDAETHVEEDYTKYLAQKVEKLKLSQETKKGVIGYIEKSPLFVDFLVNNKDKNGNRRRYGAGNLDIMYKAYTSNTELTEQLANTYNEDGKFMYTAGQILNLIEIQENCPELYETAKEQPDTVYDLYNLKDENDKPRFGISDIKMLAEKSKKFPNYTNYLLEEKDNSNRPRFNAEQIDFILNELEGEEPEFAINLVKFQQDIYTNKGDYVAAYPQTVKLSGKNIIDIIKMDKKYHVQDFVYNLMEVVDEYNITGDKFVRYTEMSTKTNVEFVKALKDQLQLHDNKYKLLAVGGRELSKEEFEELRNMKSERKPLVYVIGQESQDPLFDEYELKQIKKYVKK